MLKVITPEEQNIQNEALNGIYTCALNDYPDDAYEAEIRTGVHNAGLRRLVLQKILRTMRVGVKKFYTNISGYMDSKSQRPAFGVVINGLRVQYKTYMLMPVFARG